VDDAVSVEAPAATALNINDPVLCPAAIVTVEGDTVTLLSAELVRETLTPMAPAGRLRLTLPATALPTPIEVLGSDSVTKGRGERVTTAFADVLAALVAVTITVCALLIVAGAVYTPDVEMLPTAGLSDQVTPVLDPPETVAVKA
jgi:hypothetical protein